MVDRKKSVSQEPIEPPDGTLEPDKAGLRIDLTQGLFAKSNHAMASVVRELQVRSLRARRTGCQEIVGKVGDNKGTSKEDSHGSAMHRSTPATVEAGNGTELWVLGGATTVGEYQGAPAGKCEETVVAPISEDSTKPPPQACSPANDGVSVSNPPPDFLSARLALVDLVRLYPGTFVVPLVAFLLLAGLGTWGVIAGAQAHVQQRKDDARSRAVDAATGFQIQLQQSFTPGVTFTLLVRQRPNLEYWIQNFNATAQELMSRVPAGALWNLQLQPFAQVMMMHPLRSSDISQVNPPRDLLGDRTRRDDIMRIITTREPMVVGPVNLTNNQTGTFVRYPIYISDVDANETFGFRYFHSSANKNTPLSFSELPASVRDCSVCYNATTREKWWGLITVLVNYQAVTLGQDAYLANLRNMGYHYALVRPVNVTYEQVIAQVGPSSLRDEDVVTVEVKVVNRIWLLRVAPENGFSPSWRGPLIAAVIIIAFVIASLLFIAMASFRRHLLLLRETVAANRNLAETTKRLEEEKVRMDVLLVRQYDLLRCLDANRGDSKHDGNDSVGTSRRAMMARIEDARRSLNVAKASVEDSVQVFEVLGAGAFGKVQKGLWRGTVVAVKTMILPANMTGQEKREKMAVMEAAVSSSLVHPNIVTTYTYFIRPYHEPVHDGVQQMLVLPSRGGGQDGKARDNPLDDSAGTIHSYEVRLVLEFCDKGSLKDALDQHTFMQGGAFNLAAMLETAADVAKAMVHMHAANVLHSDLKARNIMLKSSGTEGRGVVAKVADFGLSTRMEHQETHLSSCFQGTLTHMAPEVMLEGRISKAADVYSFGILMWELFCGGDPFAGVPRAHLGHAITKENRRPKFPPFAPREYVALAARCWDPDATLRPSFDQVLAELGRMRDELGGDTQPLVIAPPRPLNPTWSGEGSPDKVSGDGSEAGGVRKLHPDLTSSGLTFGRGSPTTLLGAGIVLGGGEGSSLGTGALLGSGLGLSGTCRSSLAQRQRLKTLLAQRHLRKMGIRLGGTSSAALAQTLPALDEEAEHKEG